MTVTGPSVPDAVGCLVCGFCCAGAGAGGRWRVAGGAAVSVSLRCARARSKGSETVGW